MLTYILAPYFHDPKQGWVIVALIAIVCFLKLVWELDNKKMNKMKILDLILKGKWYDMIASGEKPEEYRVLSDHWVKRFLLLNSGRDGALKYLASLPTDQVWQEYTHVRVHRGYTSTTMLFEIKSIHIGFGNPEWGAPEEEVFIIKLGERVC